MSIAVHIVLASLGAGVLLTVVRLLKGPTLPDRVVAVDLMATLSIAILAASAIASEQPALIQPALVLALIAFLGTVAFARYVEKRASDE